MIKVQEMLKWYKHVMRNYEEYGGNSHKDVFEGENEGKNAVEVDGQFKCCIAEQFVQLQREIMQTLKNAILSMV